MDRKSLIILIASFGLIMLWFQLVNVIWPPRPVPASTNLVSQATNTLSLTNQTLAEPVVGTETPLPPEQLVTLENENAFYTFTSHGGGLKTVSFKAYDAVVACRGRKAEGLAGVNVGAPLPIAAWQASNLPATSDPYTLSQSNGLTATLAYDNGLRVVKTFQPTSNYLVKVSIHLENTSTNQPLALAASTVTAGTATPTSHRDERSNLGIFRYANGDDTHIDAGWFANRTLGCLPGKPRWLYTDSKGKPEWVAVHNQFFAIALIPAAPADRMQARPVTLPPFHGTTPPTNNSILAWQLSTNDLLNAATFLDHLRDPAHSLSAFLVGQCSADLRQRLQSPGQTPMETLLPSLLEEINKLLETTSIYEQNRAYFNQLELTPELRQLIEDHPRGEHLVRLNRLLLELAYPRDLHKSPTGYEAAVQYDGVVLAPGQSIDRDYLIYAGPREYHTLARLGGQLKNHLDKVMGYGGAFGFFAKALLLSMNGLHALGLSYAMAIIVITIIIKTLFWPLTNASTRSMKRMAALQPQMKALQERYKEDPVKMNRKLMEFMKEHKVSPLGGCLPMLLQLPVFFGFFTMIRSAIELRGAKFLWVCDLAQPDTLFIIPGFNIPFNLLPLIMGVTMLWQARLTPPSPGMDPAQQKIMRYMPLMFLVILYNFSAGLTLYWTVQNLLTITQMKLTKAKDNSAAPVGPALPARPNPQKPRRKP